jgi:hypothetical protein
MAKNCPSAHLILETLRVRLCNILNVNGAGGDSEDEAAVVVGAPLSVKSIEGYANACVKLWKDQHMLGLYDVTTFGPPTRPRSVTDLIKSYKTTVVLKSKEAFEDRGKGTLVDAIQVQTYDDIAAFFWNCNTLKDLRIRTEMMLCRGFCARGDNIRNLELSTIGAVHYNNLGVGGVDVMYISMWKTKTNQYQHHLQSTVIRHKDVTSCPIGALGFYFFARYHISKDVWPDFRQASLWYDLILLSQENDSTKRTNYSASYKKMKDAYSFLEINSNVKTHLGRKTTAADALICN